MEDVYKIGVRLVGETIGFGAFQAISSQLLGINKGLLNATANSNKLKTALQGMFQIGIGVGLLTGLNKLADKGEELIHQQQLMIAAGWKHKEVVDALNAAWKASADIPTTTPAGNMKNLREMAYATGSMKDAIAVLEPVLKANAVLNSVKGGSGDAVFALVKSLESKGLTTGEERENFLSYLNAMVQVNQASGGRVTPQMFQSTFKYSRTAKYAWSEEFITQILPRLMQEWASGSGGGGGSGSGGPGNALMSGFSQMVSGVMSKPAAQALAALGLATMTHQAGTTKAYTHVKDQDLFMQNPYEWVQRDLMPKLMARYGHDKQKIIEAIGVAFPTRTWGSAVSEFALQGRAFLGAAASPYEKDRRLTLQAGGISSFKGLSQKDPGTVEAEMGAQWETLAQAIGGPLTELRTSLEANLVPLLTNLAQLAHQHPEGIKIVAEGIAALAAVLIANGTALVIAAAISPAGWFVLGIIALGVAFKVLYDHWKPFHDQVDQLGKDLGKVLDGITALGTSKGWKPLVEGLYSLLSDLVPLSNLVDKFADSITNLVKKLGGWLSQLGNWFSHINYTGGGFGGASVYRTAYETGGFGRGAWNGANLSGVATGAYASLGSYGSPSYVASMIHAAAIRNNIDPRIALAVARSEGLFGYVGDHGTSFGPYQLHYGGGLGDVFSRMGLGDARDPRTLAAQIEFSMAYAAKHGWGSWHGAARSGIGIWDGIHKGIPSRHPADHPVHLQTAVMLDGSEIARATSKHLGRKYEHPRRAPVFDAWAGWAPPDMQTVST